jgi:hypothetical protein
VKYIQVLAPIPAPSLTRTGNVFFDAEKSAEVTRPDDDATTGRERNAAPVSMRPQ